MCPSSYFLQVFFYVPGNVCLLPNHPASAGAVWLARSLGKWQCYPSASVIKMGKGALLHCSAFVWVLLCASYAGTLLIHSSHRKKKSDEISVTLSRGKPGKVQRRQRLHSKMRRLEVEMQLTVIGLNSSQNPPGDLPFDPAIPPR